jgi:hypothetical protein
MDFPSSQEVSLIIIYAIASGIDGKWQVNGRYISDKYGIPNMIKYDERASIDCVSRMRTNSEKGGGK